MNCFTLLGLEPSFPPDPAALEAAYFAAQRRCHPDRFVGKPEAERVAAMQHSADMNWAYDTLKNPLPRARHLLALNGITVGTDNDSVKPSQELLMEVMELNETPPAKDALKKIIAESVARIGECYTTKDYDAMAQETLRLGYLVKAGL